jgi:hypothetical protein
VPFAEYDTVFMKPNTDERNQNLTQKRVVVSLNAGIGWGGTCFGKDIQSLLHTAREYGYSSRLLEATLEVNAAQRQMAIQKLQEKLYILKGRTIGLLGLAFKPDTDDLRDAPSLHIAERLLQMGARVKAYDPIANAACRQQRPDLKIRYCDSAIELVAGAMASPILVDGRNLFDPETAIAAGFDYTGIGRGGRIRPGLGAPRREAEDPAMAGLRLFNRKWTGLRPVRSDTKKTCRETSPSKS